MPSPLPCAPQEDCRAWYNALERPAWLRVLLSPGALSEVTNSRRIAPTPGTYLHAGSLTLALVPYAKGYSTFSFTVAGPVAMQDIFAQNTLSDQLPNSAVVQLLSSTYGCQQGVVQPMYSYAPPPPQGSTQGNAPPPPDIITWQDRSLPPTTSSSGLTNAQIAIIVCLVVGFFLLALLALLLLVWHRRKKWAVSKDEIARPTVINISAIAAGAPAGAVMGAADQTPTESGSENGHSGGGAPPAVAAGVSGPIDSGGHAGSSGEVSAEEPYAGGQYAGPASIPGVGLAVDPAREQGARPWAQS